MTSVKLGVTVRPPDTALSRVTVKVRASPSAALASAIVTAGGTPSSLVIVPVAVSVVFTFCSVSETARPMVNVSSSSASVSSVVATVKLCFSPAVPAKVSAAVFSV